MHSKLISVLMCTYREPVKWIESSINSILKQTYQDFEFVIVVDDPTNTDIIQCLRKFENEHDCIKIIINAKNVGLVKSLNIGIRYCKGDFIARMDADDISLPERLETELNFMLMHKYDIIGCRFESFCENEIYQSRSVPRQSYICARLLGYTNCVGHPTWIVKKEVYDALNGYREIASCEDYDFLMRAALRDYKIGCVDKCLFRYRHNPQSISSNNDVSQAVISNRLRSCYRKNRELSDVDYQEWRMSSEYSTEINLYHRYLSTRRKIEHGESNNLLLDIVRLACMRESYIKLFSKIMTIFWLLLDKIIYKLEFGILSAENQIE